ncbi:Lysyl endopeptidase [compost metagenome]
MRIKLTPSWTILLTIFLLNTACRSLDQPKNHSGKIKNYTDAITTTSLQTMESNAAFSIEGLPRPVTFTLGDMTTKDYDAMIAITKHNERKEVPLLSGFSRDIQLLPPLSLLNVRPDPSVNDKEIMLAKLDVPGAEMFRVQINFLEFPADSEVYLTSPTKNNLIRWSHSEAHLEWSPIIFGDSILLAIRSSKKIDKLNITGVLQIFPLTANGNIVKGGKAFIKGRWESLAAVSGTRPLVDSTCKTDENTRYRTSPNFVRQIESATGLLATVTSLDNVFTVSGFCTGTRVASLSDPQGYYILTANHCYSSGNPPQTNATNADLATTQVFWDYRTTTCNASGPIQFSSAELMSLPQSVGATLLGARFESDAVLFRTTPAPGTRVALGWQLGLQLTNDAFVHRVSHPNAYSTGYSLQLIDHIETLTYCESLGTPRAEYFNSSLLEGETSPGSSGSSVVTQNLRVVGQLYGSCKWSKNGHTWTTDVDGELSRSWPAFGRFLE